MSDYFVEVLYTNHNVGVGSGYMAPLGHAGFIAVNGSSGQATYYDYGRYSGTDGIVRTLDLGRFTTASTSDVYNSVLATSNKLMNYGDSAFNSLRNYGDSAFNSLSCIKKGVRSPVIADCFWREFAQSDEKKLGSRFRGNDDLVGNDKKS